MAIKRKTFSYYNYDKIMSYNAAYNFICGGRGLGKTYGAKYKAIKRAIDRGEMFVYLRRYKPELKAFESFFADIAHEFPEMEFRVNGREAQMRPAGAPDEVKFETIGYAVALSVAQSLKGMSYHMVTTIIYDEFIIEKGALQYLPNEAKRMNDFYSTVDRWQDKTRVFFLANAVSINNPYFIEYEIRPDQSKEYTLKADGFIAVHFADSSQFASEVMKTRFGQFIKGTEYADYAVGNVFEDDNDNLVDIKPSKAEYHFTLETKHGTFSVWSALEDRLTYYIQKKRPKNEDIRTLLPERMDETKTLMVYNDNPLQVLRGAFKQGRMYFDQPHTRNAFIEIFRR